MDSEVKNTEKSKKLSKSISSLYRLYDSIFTNNYLYFPGFLLFCVLELLDTFLLVLASEEFHVKIIILVKKLEAIKVRANEEDQKVLNSSKK